MRQPPPERSDPRRDEPVSERRSRLATRSGTIARAKELHLLFVDDDPLAEMTLRRAFRRLEREGPLTIAHDGLEALDVLRDPWFPIDRALVLLDLNMPRMGGLELLKELRADPELGLVPVVVMTTSDDQRDIQAAYANGASGFFVKPVAFADFVDQIGAILAYWSRAVQAGARGRSGLLPQMR